MFPENLLFMLSKVGRYEFFSTKKLFLSYIRLFTDCRWGHGLFSMISVGGIGFFHSLKGPIPYLQKVLFEFQITGGVLFLGLAPSPYETSTVSLSVCLSVSPVSDKSSHTSHHQFFLIFWLKLAFNKSRKVMFLDF